MPIRIKRVYLAPAADDGLRVLVDRLWPRGLSKEKAAIDVWMKDIAPSAALRRSFGHEASRWNEFTSAYFRELDEQEAAVCLLLDHARRGRLTLLYAARNERCNNAVALRDYLAGKRC